jgi:diacylglycerol kinase (ATP)
VEAARVIAAGTLRQIDLGLVNGHPFFNVASVGLSADLARSLGRDLKQRFGRLGYGVAAARLLARARPFAATIVSADEQTRVSTLQIAVGNGRHYGGGNVVERTARIDDQQLDLYSLEFSRAWKLAMLARSFRRGVHGARPEVRTLRGREFTVLTRRPRPVNADGELVTSTPALFTLAPGAVRVFVPAEPGNA